ncbi:guanosine monophosphate reductase [Actinopolyspora erythraea]|uniref:GMP reductase n=1 Tax=Actinopolyspora erythraea TaxID=414996 RepID=A0A099D601_9ACTN|nr:IMP dehydrogenase [Actinopolyspora erythraea]ASU78921.1 guanosine monophosphate reductase [Actinopolyspora erythraea]KGI81262.1 GMP reductase [Actinopolyspora erythraea]
MSFRKPRVRSGLSFDDVLLVPQRTRAHSRRDVELSTRLTTDITLGMPLLSANTPWCTGAEMAVGMARAGGCGFVHRMQPVEEQARQVAEVKNTPADETSFPGASRDGWGRLRVGAAVGVRDEFLERARQLVDAGVDVLVIDIAHGHSTQTLAALEKLRENHPDVGLMAGNVATAEGTRDLVEAGAQAVKVGIGPGGICTTRQVAGAGVPQITAIMDCAEAAAEFDVPVVADGGVRSSGDMVKALAAGASSVMLGSMLAGVDESAALLVEQDGAKYKVTTGFVTLGVPLTLKRQRGERITRRELEEYVPEGVEASFDYLGGLDTVLTQYTGGIRSGVSYSGALDIAELHGKAEFTRVTPAGLGENRPHAVERTRQVHPDYRSDFLAEATSS